MGARKPVPPYEHNSHYPASGHMDASAWPMNRQQAGFYRRWQNAWKRGEALDVEGHIDYVRKYISQKMWEIPKGTALREITRIHHRYGDGENDFLTQEIANIFILHGAYESAINVLEAGKRDNYYISRRIADCHFLLGDYRKAHKALRHLIELGTRRQALIDDIWSLKLIAGDNINGKEMLTLLGPQLTAFGKANIESVRDCLDRLIRLYERAKNVCLLEVWASESHSYIKSIKTGDESTSSSIRGYSFGRCGSVIAFVKEISRLAENLVREEAGLPNVGEGWLSETVLYQRLKRALPGYRVQQHYRPYWLGLQHLDIYIHELGIALEYQGLQHDEPVEFFGGQEAFEQNRERDARKRRLCDKYDVPLIYVRSDYNFSKLLKEISDRSNGQIEFYRRDRPTEIQLGVERRTEELLRIDALSRPKRLKKEYKINPAILIEPIHFDLSYKVSMRKVKRYQTLSYEIRAAYSPRNNPSGIDEAIELCNKQIPLSYNMAQYEYQDRVARSEKCLEEANNCENDPERRQDKLQAAERIMSFGYDQVGYQVIVKIYEKQRNFQAALEYALRAKSECWYPTPHWDKKIFQLYNRVVRLET